ncbi:Uma2 family endonuclease [Candidatus Acetothermia bacterium]|nr:Uma2 family endonuclease [Candidatus Acetothermia bacterium]MBI3460691.1 Uma2 family endonuclease [Candidatus Acetothermia bacterium]MBI3660358.1 Uma2 family endonuclease [Candidatus Acetothermia bacterium]
MAVEIKRKLFSVAEYHKMIEAGVLHEDDRLELLGGEIVAMSPIGSRHAACVDRLNRLFTKRLGDSVIVRVQNPVELSDESEPQPDLSLLKPRTDFYSEAHPQSSDIYLLVEVADTTANYDRRVKLPFYARAGIIEIWLIDLEVQQIEVYREPSAKGYRQTQVVERGQSLKIQAFPDVELKANEILG